MFYIDSVVDKPNIKYLQDRHREMLADGIAVSDLNKLLIDYRAIYNELRANLIKTYKIENPNSYNQMLEYFDKCLLEDTQKVISELGVDLSLYRRDMMNIVFRLHNDGVYPEDVTMEDVEAIVQNTGEMVLIENVEAVYTFIKTMLGNDIIQCMLKGGKWTTNKEALAMMALKGHKSAVDIMSYRKAKNFYDTVSSFHSAIAGDGRVHPKMSIGKSNRIEYREPALMNIPKQILWEIVVPKTEGNMLVSIDIKNQEPWIMINMLGIERLRAMAEADGDLYESVFWDIFGREPAPIERKELKVAWNAMTYGATKFGIKAMCRNIDGEKVYQYFNKIEEFKKYKSEKGRLAKAGVQTATTYFGTELRANEYTQSKLKRVLMDIPIQGTGTDILALLVEHFDEEVEIRGLEDIIELYFTRKDELVVEVEKAFVEEVGKEEVFRILADIFEHRIDDWEPFKVKISEAGTEKADTLFVEDDE